MGNLTAYNLVNFINTLPRNREYNYISKSNHGLIHIDEITLPSGPVYFRRYNPLKKETLSKAKSERISSEMIWRIANAIEEGVPINFDRILGASYNTRSVFETLLVSTPQFYYCYPGRIKDVDGTSSIEKGHKHVIWLPDKPHSIGELCKFNVEHMAISEIPLQTVTYDSLIIPENIQVGGDIDIDVIRRHTQIQIALYLIGSQLGYRTWIAQNDKGIIYKDKQLLTYPGIVKDLKNERIISVFNGAATAAKYIDCVWFESDKNMPAVMEVEHTTGIVSGLIRMKELQSALPSIKTKYVIVAPDEQREKVIKEANREQFRCLDARFFPYSSVEELFYICNKRHLKGVNFDFLDCYMEKILI